jgi:hypothetical protein
MTIVDKGVMPDGTEIQLEDWRQDYDNLFGYMIATYPIAKNTGKRGWVRGGREFRLSITINECKNYDAVKAEYDALIRGEKTLEDMAQYFYDGERAMWYLGMNVKRKDWY